MSRHVVFITGGTGYLGQQLLPALLERGHRVRALVRPGSEHRLAPGAELVRGNALDADSFAGEIPPVDTLVHMVGTPRPSPAKAAQFRAVDLASVRAAATAALRARVRHLVYVSVAQPAPVMRAYIGVREEAEALLRATGLSLTVLRPWYVLGPGHRWPYLLLPLYALLRRLPATRAGAERLGLVTRREMITSLVRAVELPPGGVQIVDVPGIRAS